MPFSDPVARFVHALDETKVVDDILDFQGVHLFGLLTDVTSPTKMFVRHCYKELFDIITRESVLPKHLLLGSPGIGKSVFGIYFVKRLLDLHDQSRRKILWLISVVEQLVVLHCDTVPLRLDVMSLERGRLHIFDQRLLDQPDNWCIFDGVTPLQHKMICHSMMISSPRSGRYSHYEKGSVNERFMPVWSVDEMSIAETRIYSQSALHNKPELWLMLHDVFGNIPRHVYEEVGKYAGMSLADAKSKALSIIRPSFGKLGDITSLMAEHDRIVAGEASDVSHLVLHIDSPPPYYLQYVRWSSQLVADELAERLMASAEARHALWVAVVGELGKGGNLAGILFEQLVHRMLRKKHSWPIRALVPRGYQGKRVKQTTLKLVDAERRIWRKIEETKEFTSDTQYGIPRSQNEKAIDALQQPNSLFQVTMKLEHPMNLKGVKDAVKQLRGRTNRVYFVVPEQIFDRWVYEQSYQPADQLDELPSTVLQQFVLSFDPTSR